MEATRPSSPSFNSYSSSSASVNLTETAARVVEEFRELGWEEAVLESKQDDVDDDDDDGDMKEDEFEFAFVCNNNKMQESPISADEIFFNGQIKPFYPLFDNDNRPRNRSPLGKLMREERENDVSLSCSSSEEADDLDSLQPGTYCVWTPEASANSKESSSSSGRCNNNRKSHSTGSSSKRWNKLRDLLLNRSYSDGKDTFVFLTPPTIHDNNNNNNKKKGSAQEIKDSDKSISNNNNNNNNNKASNKAVQKQYVRNRSIKEEDKERSFSSPYRQDLMGFFNDI